jgi:hypothetical protein
MATFKVVLDGIDLSDEQTDRVSKAIQRSVMLELADLGSGPENAGEPPAFSVALPGLAGLIAGQPIVCGLVATTDVASLGALVGAFRSTGGESQPG